MKSFTRLWAPNEMASPMIPAPASSGPISTKRLSVRRNATTIIVVPPTVRSSWAMVMPRFSRSEVTVAIAVVHHALDPAGGEPDETRR